MAKKAGKKRCFSLTFSQTRKPGFLAPQIKIKLVWADDRLYPTILGNPMGSLLRNPAEMSIPVVPFSLSLYSIFSLLLRSLSCVFIRVCFAAARAVAELSSRAARPIQPATSAGPNLFPRRRTAPPKREIEPQNESQRALR